MLKPLIEVQHVSKRYQIGAQRQKYHSLRDEIVNRFQSASRKAKAAQQEFWALNDVSFEIEEGEAVGIIGRNGAGKSTLLKVLSKITPPTAGHIAMRGRVGSLLEVGTGFHPELSGRENIFLNGAILGMTRREIQRKFDEIVAFADCAKFLDTPVKRYSSGMYVRLAFAVAANLEPEILIVDEVLAVGDAEFQKKCLGKMGDVAKSGRTVLFVSHNMPAVMQLCNRCVRLSHGKVAEVGETKDVVRGYLGAVQGTHYVSDTPEVTGAAKIREAWIAEPSDGNLEFGDTLEIHADVLSRVPVQLTLEVIIRDDNYHPVIFLPSGLRFGVEYSLVPGEAQRLICRIPKMPLAEGNYTVDLILGGETGYDMQESALAFEVVASDPCHTGRSFTQSSRQGCIHLDAQFTSGIPNLAPLEAVDA